ncbi:hypothetical protein [Kroppenstedtia eburnea]|nr:hypothetical protein [Kroppenstedtia eburnea]QKI80713.1 hypothetical protein GXN75_01040 [Kroppenstedtia eburnea]
MKDAMKTLGQMEKISTDTDEYSALKDLLWDRKEKLETYSQQRHDELDKELQRNRDELQDYIDKKRDDKQSGL